MRSTRFLYALVATIGVAVTLHAEPLRFSAFG